MFAQGSKKIKAQFSLTLNLQGTLRSLPGEEKLSINLLPLLSTPVKKEKKRKHSTSEEEADVTQTPVKDSGDGEEKKKKKKKKKDKGDDEAEENEAEVNIRVVFFLSQLLDNMEHI